MTRGPSQHVWLVFCSTGLLVFSTVMVAQTKGRHTLTFDDFDHAGNLMGSLKTATYLELSPDGRSLVYSLDGDIWLVATEAGSSPTRLGKGTIPAWSPDGQRLAYYSSDSGTFQLWVRDMQSGRTQQLTSLDGGIHPDPRLVFYGYTNYALIYRWSPDGRKIVFSSDLISTDRLATRDIKYGSLATGALDHTERPLVLTTTTPPQWTLSGLFRGGGFDGPEWMDGKYEAHPASAKPASPPKANQLFIVDSGTKEIIQLTKDDGGYFYPKWSSTGRTIICDSTEGRSLAAYGPETTNIYAIDVASGNKQALTTGLGWKAWPSWSPDGKWIAYVGGEKFQMKSVFVMPGGGGEAANVTSELDRNVREFGWGSDSKSIVITYDDGVTARLARILVRTERLEQVGQNQPTDRGRVTIASSGAIGWQESDGSTPGVIRILRPGEKDSRVLVDLNPQSRDWALGKQEVVHWKNRRGDELEGILIKPVGYNPGSRYPLIVEAYPGLKSSFMGLAHLWASEGYVIFWPNARAPHVWQNPFKSRAYDQAAKGPKGWDVTVDDIMSGVDDLIQRGIVDPDRMGIYGISNGGAIVNQMVTRTNRFKCAVSIAAATSADWSTLFFLSTADPIIPQLAGVTPWQDPDAYIRLSAVYRLDKVSTPMLLADGDNDGFFLLGEIEMYNGLRYLGKDVTLLRYPGQGHGFTGWAMRDFWERENTFFDKYLKPDQPVK